MSEGHTQPVLFVLKQIYEALRPWKQFSRQFDGLKFYMSNYEYLLEKINKQHHFQGYKNDKSMIGSHLKPPLGWNGYKHLISCYKTIWKFHTNIV